MTMVFLQSNWATLKEDVMNMLAEFYSSGKFVVSLNSLSSVSFLRKQGPLI